MPGGPSLPQVLVESLRPLFRGAGGTSTLELAVETATTLEDDRRAWLLVALAGRLRQEGSNELARRAVGAALALDAGPGPTRAAHACEVALHADDGDLDTAVKLGEALLADGHDAYLLTTMVGVYWRLWRQTKDETWQDRWRRVHVRLHEAAAA